MEAGRISWFSRPQIGWGRDGREEEGIGWRDGEGWGGDGVSEWMRNGRNGRKEKCLFLSLPTPSLMWQGSGEGKGDKNSSCYVRRR